VALIAPHLTSLNTYVMVIIELMIAVACAWFVLLEMFTAAIYQTIGVHASRFKHTEIQILLTVS
jgi:hypothetical protein